MSRILTWDKSKTVSEGISFGCALAICISWSIHHSVLWAILQGFLSWVYVIYFIFIFTR